jgi:hypothetical protein
MKSVTEAVKEYESIYTLIEEEEEDEEEELYATEEED